MSFSVELAADQYVVEAGSTVPLTFSVLNTGDSSEPIEVSVEGLDTDWTAIPIPTFTLAAGEKQSEKVFLKPPRISESQAGDYPFVVRIRSMESGDSRALQAMLVIKPFHYLSMEISPKKGIFSPGRKENDFQMTLMNLGNAEENLQVFANDPEDELTYAFETEQVSLGPGQSKEVGVVVAPSRSRLLASSRLHGFSVGARSVDTPSLVCTSQAQLVQKALLSPGNFALFLAILAIFFGWLALLPKPPEMSFLRLSRSEAYAGDRIMVRWAANNASRVRIKLGSETVVDTLELIGSQEFVATTSGTVEAIAVRDGKQSEALTAELRVTEKPVVPKPEIATFSISPKVVNQGDKLSVRYRVSESVTKLTLSPPGQILDPKIESIFLTADVIGSITYTLVAENSAGITTKQSITVVVNDPTLPKIDEFKAVPEKLDVEIGTVTLSWRTTNAVRVEIIMDKEKLDVAEIAGVKEVALSKTSEIKLIAYDSQGRTQTKTIKVEVKQVPSIDPNADPASTTGGSTTGGGVRSTGGAGN